jgi:hypothetical protein
LKTSGIQVLYDSARLAVGRTSVIIHDGKYNEDFAKVTFTVVFNKDTKYAIVYKDVKILLDPKVLDSIVDFAFSERYELDLARNINPRNEAYIHYFHNYLNTVYQHPLTGENKCDVLQAFDSGQNYIFFAGYWPNATSGRHNGSASGLRAARYAKPTRRAGHPMGSSSMALQLR